MDLKRVDRGGWEEQSKEILTANKYRKRRTTMAGIRDRETAFHTPTRAKSSVNKDVGKLELSTCFCYTVTTVENDYFIIIREILSHGKKNTRPRLPCRTVYKSENLGKKLNVHHEEN